MGVEPRLGKIILDNLSKHLGREGLVLASLMENAGSIFCRFGTEEEKSKSDCLKLCFCHPDGDPLLFFQFTRSGRININSVGTNGVGKIASVPNPW